MNRQETEDFYCIEAILYDTLMVETSLYIY